ncbi:MAG: Na/Pi cotransporter family protein [Kiritimatiellia bacterium]
MKEIAIVLLTVAGGLGTFLLGMKHLSEGLQAVSGRGLKRFMAFATTHRLAGVATGIVSTVIVQSSSIITVMAVGFVSSGLLNLTQAINVIIGSNIGTTATAWLIAYVPDVGLLGLGVIGLGAVLYFFFSRESVHNLGLALMGLGFVFMGLYWMNQGVAPIRTNPSIRAAFATLDAGDAWGLFKCFGVSLVFTAVVQSSAATTAIAMTLAIQGIITFEAAAATVFGMNVGTTVTAWLAALGGTTAARRTALAHTLFNVIGAALLMPFFIPVMLPLVKALFPSWATSPAAPMAAIHTIFNVVTTLVFLPYVEPFARLVERLVPPRADETADVPRLSYLDHHVKLSPQIACGQAFSEVCFMSTSDAELLDTVRGVLTGTATREAEEHVFHREAVLDRVQREITEFLGRVMTSRLPVDVADQARALLRVTDELESVSDEMPVIVRAYRRIRDDIGSRLEPGALAVVLDLLDRLDAFAYAVNVSLRFCETTMGANPVANAAELSADIRRRVREARQAALLGVGTDETAPLRTLAQLDILNAIDRIRSCYLNIAETLAGGKHEMV